MFLYFLSRQTSLAASSQRISIDANGEAFFPFFQFYVFFNAYLFLLASSLFTDPGPDLDRARPTWTDSHQSLLHSYRISNVDIEVLDYQLAALRTEFIWPSLKES